MAQGEEFLKARLEKDLAELKKMIDTHFVQRKKDEEEIAALETRIEERKAVSFHSMVPYTQNWQNISWVGMRMFSASRTTTR